MPIYESDQLFFVDDENNLIIVKIAVINIDCMALTVCMPTFKLDK